MTKPLDVALDFVSVIGAFWIIFVLFCIFSVQRFIVKRYEKETNLLESVFFDQHFAFTRHMPGFLSSSIYAGHLLACTWGWCIYRKSKMFKDIDSPNVVIKHFSKKEINSVKRLFVAIIMVILHMVSLSILGYLK